MTGFTITDTMPANVLKMGACCLLDGRIYRCIRRAAVITLADVETGATRDVAGIQDVARALSSGEPGLILGHVAGAVLTVGAAPAGVLVLVRTGWRWELARADPSIIHIRRRPCRGFRAVTPWQRSPTRFRTPVDAPCWLAVPIADVQLRHVRAKPAAVKRARPSRARPRSEHALRKPPPVASQLVIARSAPIVDVPKPAPPPARAPSPPADLPSWWTLHRTTRDGRQETLLFAERRDADAFVRLRGWERSPTLARGNFKTESTADGLLRVALPPRTFGGKQIPPRKQRLPHKDDEEDED